MFISRAKKNFSFASFVEKNANEDLALRIGIDESSNDDEGSNFNFCGTKKAAVPNLSTTNNSLTKKSKTVKSIIDCFNLFVNEEIRNIIISNTNKKATRHKSNNETWVPLDESEINKFLGLLLTMGMFHDARKCKEESWNTSDSLLEHIYGIIMPCDRFTDILENICFEDPDAHAHRRENDKFLPLKTVTNIFAQNCRDSYNATDIGCVGEQLIDFQGDYPFKEYNCSGCSKSKGSGIKVRVLCDSQTYYCCNMNINVHQDFKQDQESKDLKALLNFWKNSGRCITMENFVDFETIRELLKDKIFFVGSIESKNCFIPKRIYKENDLRRYSSKFEFQNKLTFVSYKPKDNECMKLVSSLQNEHNIVLQEGVMKSNIVNFYYTTKDGVNILDSIVREYSCQYYTQNWQLAIFMHYIDIASYNAFVVWILKNKDWKSSLSMQKRRKIFLEELTKELIKIDKPL